MRVLQVTLDLSTHSTGVYTSVLNFNRAMHNAGHEVRILSFDRRPRSKDRIAGIQGIRAVQLPGLNRYAFSRQGSEWLPALNAADTVLVHSLYGFHADWVFANIRPSQRLLIVPHG